MDRGTDTGVQGESSGSITIREDSQRIGKFVLMERLGKGASGTVYRALDTFTGTEVALKVLDAGCSIRWWTGSRLRMSASPTRRLFFSARCRGRRRRPPAGPRR